MMAVTYVADGAVWKAWAGHPLDRNLWLVEL